MNFENCGDHVMKGFNPKIINKVIEILSKTEHFFQITYLDVVFLDNDLFI